MRHHVLYLALLPFLTPCRANAQLQKEEPSAAPVSQRAEITVGIDEGDIRGSDNRALQAGVDAVAALGGGTVHIRPGRYTMRNALVLRDNVRVVGTRGKSILAACDGAVSRLQCDGDCNERQITVDDPSGFHVGDGVAVRDDNAGGFMVTTATLTKRIDSNTFALSAPLYLDYMVGNNARAEIAFPIVGAWRVHNAAVESLTIEGNASNRTSLDGCRGGGIYFFECRDMAIRGCEVRGYNGDGISFQVSEDVIVEDCVARENRGLGLHPGSGSTRPVVRRNRSISNGRDGLYVCWRVKHGQFDENELIGNKGVGISIGHKDTDNRFTGNTITNNKQAGVLFREETKPMGAHRNVFERNRIVDNGDLAGGRSVAIEIRGHHNELVFRDNTIGSTASGDPSRAIGIVRGPHAERLLLIDNNYLHVAREVEAPEK